jgi:hypothetical protein
LATAGSTIYGFDEDCYLTKPRETSWRLCVFEGGAYFA